MRKVTNPKIHWESGWVIFETGLGNTGWGVKKILGTGGGGGHFEHYF